MRDFKYFTPTEVVFGRESEAALPGLLKKYGAGKVLIHYGGGSAVKSGLIPSMEAALTEACIPFVKLGGVVPNPHLSLVYEGIELCRKEHVDFILAVGGGSVIDSSKAIAYGLAYEGDVWDFYDAKAVPKASYPVGVVLTIPASGSEMSDSSVITNTERGQKRGCNSDFCRPRFAIMNPERSYTLPAFQTACGVTDIMMHTMERYFSKYQDMTLTDALSEALLRTVKDAALAVMGAPTDYRLRAQIMWAGSLAHNDLTECGTEKDFATHKLEHELSALYGVTHGAGLAALWPSWARFVMPRHLSRFVQFAVNVMGISNDFSHPAQTAEQGVRAMEAFYRTIGMPTNIPELLGRQLSAKEINVLVEKCSRGGTCVLGSLERIDAEAMRAIYELANKK